jgi:hypothetical protein
MMRGYSGVSSPFAPIPVYNEEVDTTCTTNAATGRAEEEALVVAETIAELHTQASLFHSLMVR